MTGAEHMRARAAKLRAQGLCVRGCGRKIGNSVSRCDVCLDVAKQKQKARATRLKAEGLCRTGCGEKVQAGYTERCASCHSAHLSVQKSRRAEQKAIIASHEARRNKPMSSTRSRKRAVEAPQEGAKAVAYRKGLRDTLAILNKGWVSVRELSIRLDSPTKSGNPLTRAATYSRISKLRELGYVVEDKPVRVKGTGRLTVVLHCAEKSLEKLEGLN